MRNCTCTIDITEEVKRQRQSNKKKENVRGLEMDRSGKNRTEKDIEGQKRA